MNDLISRQAAIEHLKKRLYETALNNDTEHPYYEEMADNRVSVWLDEVPTIEPKRGKWVTTPYTDYDDAWECSACGCLWTFIEGTPKDNGANYCPNCGAKMDGGEE